ncbi:MULTISPECIES: hypothetical protein [unclassified Thioclava]|uniref:hypothetical protein n=1 Tax=unclassified Thioclava TaxID=2621713 RepID=UPI00117FE48A|nr:MULTISPECIES: hypothetical protein [unclassified Thioclava]
MQERYLGDSHDFVKYAILRSLHAEFGGPLGLNWYLTDPHSVDEIGNADGEKRHHFNQPIWRRCDADLLEKLERFRLPEARSLNEAESAQIVPEDTIFHNDFVPAEPGARRRWHQEALLKLEPCQVVFVDPDNGFEVKSMRRKTSPKYALHEEIDDYRARAKITVSIQFARQCNPIQRASDLRDRRSERFVEDGKLPVLRARLAPNLLFLLGAPAEYQPRLIGALDKLVKRLPGKLEWIPV